MRLMPSLGALFPKLIVKMIIEAAFGTRWAVMRFLLSDCGSEKWHRLSSLWETRPQAGKPVSHSRSVTV